MSDSPKMLITGPSPRGWHRLQQAAECLQKYAWMYENPDKMAEGVDRTKSPALAKGTLMHLALAQHYSRIKAEQEGGNEDEWMEPIDAIEIHAKEIGHPNLVSEVSAAYRQYSKTFPYDADQFKVIAVEELFETMIAGKYRLTGRMDLVLEDMAGRIIAFDHKTTGRITHAHKEYYTVSGQLLGYGHMCREKFGDRFLGMSVNLIEVAATPQIQRITLPRSPNLEARFPRIVMDIEESIERMQDSGRAYDDWPKAVNEMTCYGRYGACKYIDQCRWGANAAKAGNFVVDGKSFVR